MIVSVFFCLISFFIGLYLFYRTSLVTVNIFLVFLLSFYGHILGTYYYSLGKSDSVVQFFQFATPIFRDFGTNFVKNMVWYVRYFFTGDSILATFYFFLIFSFLGSVMWYILYIKCAKRYQLNLGLVWPALLLMCWPSSLVFTAGMGKDSMCFFFIPLAILAYLNILDKKQVFYNSFIFAISLGVLYVLRPYLLMIFIFAMCLQSVNKKQDFKIKNLFLFSAIIGIAVFVFIFVLNTQGDVSTIDINTIASRSLKQQDMQAVGTHFDMPSDNPIIRLLLLPYSFVMNLCFPIFYLARNVEGFSASFENLLLLSLILRLIKSRKLIINLLKKDVNLTFIFYFFIFGMTFMAFLNTNLGLSMRQKTMYLPCLLILYCLVYGIRKKNLRLR